MSGLPSGTVTFLFTDIEGSTRLLRRLGERYADVLSRHDHLIRAACGGHGGREVNTQGDAFFVAFARARDAVAAAMQVQRALAAEPWPEGADVRVRIGLHTGEPMVGGHDYVGLAVHRAARICSVGHGGQVLLSSATRELLEDDLPAGISFSDLGHRRLKDFDQPQHLFQVIVDDLPVDFPPPTSAPGGHVAEGGLPPVPNRTIGREHDVSAIADGLRATAVRLLTLTGPGGVGKTRLALEAGRAVEADFDYGARFVSLAAVRRASDVAPAIVQVLGIVPLRGETSEQAVMRALSGTDVLLILDNVEQLLPAASFVSELLGACPGLTLLATSREPLALQAERRYPVAPLTLPDTGAPADPAELGRVDSIALFCERARARDPDFRLDGDNAAVVGEICRRLDGLPLAIELAAARCGLLSPAEIGERLGAAFGALGAGARDVPARQQTLRATIDWSHDLLTDAEKQCFARFAVFAGGATVHAAEQITSASLDTLDHLVAKNLLVRRHGAQTPTRLGMLETIRAYSIERLAAAADEEAVFERHFSYFLALAQDDGTDQALMTAGRGEHLARLDAEVDNLHAALGWAVAQASAERALAMATALGWYWLMRYRWSDAIEWIDRALGIDGAHAHPALRVRALTVKGWCLWPEGHRADQGALFAEAEAIARQLGDPLILSQALQVRADYESGGGRTDAADPLADEALACARTAGDEWEIACASRAKARGASTAAELRERVDRAASLLHDVGNIFQLADLLTSAAYSALNDGSDHDAKDLVARAIPVVRELDSPFIWMILQGNIGLAALFTGETDAARRAFHEELTLCRDLVVRPIASEGLLGLAALAALRDDARRAARLAGASAAHRYSQPREPVDARLDAILDAARARHSTNLWEAAAREGAMLSFDDAISYALEGSGGQA